MQEQQEVCKDILAQGLEPMQEDLGRCVTDLVNAIAKVATDELENHNLRLTEYHILRFCLERSGCTATEIAAELPVNASRVSRTVNGLVEKKLLVRRRLRQDRRIVMLHLSERGRDLTKDLIYRIQGSYSSLTDNITPADLRVFVDVSNRISDNFKTAERPGANRQ